MRYDNDGTKIPRTHFVIERLLDSGVSDEHEVAELEVVLDDGGGMLLFEMDCSFDSSGVDIGGECSQVRSTFLKSNSMPSD